MSRTLVALLTTLLFVVCQASELSAQIKNSSLAQPATGSSFFRTSFDCTKAKDSSVEEAICRDQVLAKLDLEMADTYEKRLKTATVSLKRELVSSQKKWLAIRDSYAVNRFYGDPVGTLSDIAEFYRNRIKALRSGQVVLLNTKLPPEYAWLKTIAQEGFSKGFLIGRGYMTCGDPCQGKTSLYRVLSISGGGIGEPPGDVGVPYAKALQKLTSEGWAKCRSASDDSGKLSVDFFKKKNKMVALSTSNSMGTGNGIGFSIAISGPLAEPPSQKSPNAFVDITADWTNYSDPQFGLEVRYPPNWWMRDDSVPNSGTKHLTFGAKDYTGDFRISVMPKEKWNPQWTSKDPDTGQQCTPSNYQISGLPSHACLYEGEFAGVGVCTRYLSSVDVETGKYHLRFVPAVSGSFADESHRYKLNDLYEKILSTIKIN